MFILDKPPSSDHLPLCCTCRFELDVESSDSSGDDVIVPSTNYQWCKASDAEIENCTCRFELDLELSDSSGDDVIVPSTNYQWCKASDAEIENYRLSSQTQLSEINIPDAVRSYDTACVCDEYKVQLNDYFGSICEALLKASIKSIPTSIFKCSVITLYQVLRNMSESYMTLLEVLISFGDSLVNHVVMSQSVICGQAD